MSNERDGEMPEALCAWLAEVEEIKRKARERGFRRTVTNTREGWDTLTRRHVTEVPDLPWIQDEMIAGPDYRVPVRLYDPEPETPLPVALFVHGGGHISGSVAIYDPIARKLAQATRHVVVAIEYRLAPECPYPAALKDTMACAKRVFRLLETLGMPHVPRLALIGDSGGGALCATASHLAQYEPGIEIDRQVLIYPGLDYTLSQPSVIANGEGYLLERERIMWMFDAYLQNAENRRSVSPLFMDITPAYPPTLIVTAALDPLHDEGALYATRLREAGIPADHLDLPGMIHGFLNLEALVPDACRETYAAIGNFLGR